MSRGRVVITGGPGGGKTTAADLFRREIGDRVAVVPEAATLLYAGGFPRSSVSQVRRAAQLTIYNLQRNLEEVTSALSPRSVLLCDRGTVDGAAYWPDEASTFFAAAGSTIEAELARYDAVIFFESSAVGGRPASSNNPERTETLAEAAALDAKLRSFWSAHPHFALVPHHASFIQKIMTGLEVLTAQVERLERER